MFMHDDFGLLAGGAEAVANEVDLRFHHGKVMLRSSLQNEARTEGREIRNAGDIKENILRQHSSKARKNLLCPPALALKIDDIRLHEHRAAVAEHRHRLRRESQIRILLYIQAEALRRGLQKISVPRRALRIELKIFHPAVMQNDDLDVLSADIDNHMRIFVELQSRFRMRDRLNQSHVGLENILQNVFRISRGRDSQNFQFGVLRLDLAAQVFKHLDRVLNRIPVRELIRLAEYLALLVQQNRFRRG